MKMNGKIASLLALGFLIISCESDDNSVDLPKGEYDNGILISNEGAFSGGTGTINYISDDYSTMESEVYKKVNNEDLGTIVQSIGFNDDEAYIIANVSNKISIVNRNTFEKLGEITTGLNNPRYFAVSNGKGYVSNWGDTADENDDYIAIINLSSFAIEGTIPVVLGPEKLLGENNVLYVAHSGAYGTNNKVSVINTITNELSSTIEVGDVPNSMQIEDGYLWVLASGKPNYIPGVEETGGVLSKINTRDYSDIVNYTFGVTEHPGSLGLDDDEFYYGLGGSIYKMDIEDTELPTSAYIENISYYNMTIHDDKMYVTDAKDYASNGSVSIYDLETKELEQTFDVGLIPGGVYFN
ncbi:DUF5074 domain-containing protein [Cellulophaga fucicola]|uniref:40-residue YVTN family beta-propeller repeat-containing protein n=1 Tax=Cellulophaga fucicola TaxID=76595 RepID=A0A1K1LTM2_9FLAO|nr:DUF5074 domain-containing protein [Cellulophaga fucicola]SFW14231.1 hypothetical protein SAMN05660313_00061 [Cellulophaga fucicola]